jgi:hypothetical protein
MTTTCRALILALAAAAAGCATTTGTAPTETRAGFDGARVVDIAPHGAACTGMPCVSLGAQWSSANAASALLRVRLTGSAYTGIRRVELNIDGITRSLETSAGLTRFSSAVPPLRDSDQVFGVPLATVQALATARRAWVRVHTGEGYIDAAVIDGDADSKAVHALRRFLAQQQGAAQ